jgi:uncharacterized protein (TIGR02266 family)
MGLENRQQTRFQTRIFGVFKSDIDLDETEVLMLNISSGGAFVKTDNPAPPGTPITLRVYLAPDADPLSVSAEVVWWKTRDRDENPGMGVRFVRVAKGDLEAIKTYLAELISEDLFS